MNVIGEKRRTDSLHGSRPHFRSFDSLSSTKSFDFCLFVSFDMTETNAESAQCTLFVWPNQETFNTRRIRTKFVWVSVSLTAKWPYHHDHRAIDGGNAMPCLGQFRTEQFQRSFGSSLFPYTHTLASTTNDVLGCNEWNSIDNTRWDAVHVKMNEQFMVQDDTERKWKWIEFRCVCCFCTTIACDDHVSSVERLWLRCADVTGLCKAGFVSMIDVGEY